ncbi:MAG: serine/threonine protein kinase [Bradymonadia bacterium]
MAIGRLTAGEVAAKLLTERTPAQRDLFRREVCLLRLLRLPGIVNFIGADEHLGQPYLVTERINGSPFPGSTAKSWEEREETVIAFFEALDPVLTQGVVHLDLKPSNVLVKASGEPVILDFGVAIPPASRLNEPPMLRARDIGFHGP